MMREKINTIFCVVIVNFFTLIGNAQSFKSVDAKPSKYNLDKSITFSFRSEKDSIPVEKFIYTYDSLGNNTVYLALEWDKITKKWINDDKKEIIYDAKGKILSSIRYNWVVDKWMPNGQKIDFVYDADGREILKSFLVWNEKGSVWLSSSKTESKYDASGNKILEVIYLWDPKNNMWLNNVKHERTFDSKNHETRVIASVWSQKTNDWVMSSKHVKKYDGANRKTVEVDISWDGKQNRWVYKKDSSMTFDNNGNFILSNNFIYNEKSNLWDLTSKKNYSYDALGNMISEDFALWDSVNKIFTNINKTESVFDATSFKTTETKFSWDKKNNAWVAMHKFTYDAENDKTPIAEYELDAATRELSLKWQREYKSDAKGKIVLRTYNHDWDPIAKKWKQQGEEQYFYDANGNKRLLIYSNINLISNTTNGSEKVYYYYSLKK